MSTGAKQSNQAPTQDRSGGNVVGKAPDGKLHQPSRFLGTGGQSDNQSTNRGKGRT